MKGPSLEKQFNKILKENSKDLFLTVILQQYTTHDYPGCGCAEVILQPEVPGIIKDFELIIDNPEKFEKCKNILSKDLKCKDCQQCGLLRKSSTFIPCNEIQRFDIG